jgi:hypothetical protein
VVGGRLVVGNHVVVEKNPAVGERLVAGNNVVVEKSSIVLG